MQQPDPLAPLSRLHRVPVPADLRDRIEARIAAANAPVSLSPRWAWAAAAAFALLVSTNIWFLRQSGTPNSGTTSSELQAVASEWGGIVSYQLYDD